LDNNKLLQELKLYLETKLDLKILKILMFGSRINGNQKINSDYDILILLENDYDWILEQNIYDTSYDIMLKYDLILDVKIISLNELNSLKGKQPFIKNALKSEVFV